MAGETKSDKMSDEMVKNSKAEMVKNSKAEMVNKSSKADPSSKTNDAPLPHKDGALSDATSCVSSVDAVGSVKEAEVDQESMISEQAIYYPPGSYHGYYYPGFENTYLEWTDPNFYVQACGLEMQQPVGQQDGGAVMYYAPGFQPGCNPYAAFVPGAMVGVDGQYMYQQPYVLSPVIPQSPGSPAYITSPVGYGPEMIPAYSWDTSFWDGYNMSGFDETLNFPAHKTKSYSKTQPSKTNNQKLNNPVERKVQAPVLEIPPNIDVANQSTKSVNKVPNLSKGYFPMTKAPSHSPQGSPGILYRTTPVSANETSRNWFDPEKLKARTKPNTDAFDSIIEQNRGPRTDNYKTSWTSSATQTDSPVGGTDDRSDRTVVIRRDDYNLPDFPTKYAHAMFFVIKSYSEDDIHKSIKYNVWASTPNGNRRLDTVYQAAQEKMGEKGDRCPVFLFFSVNASGQFCGVAEMIGRVDFNKNMDFWQQDKWHGFFPVKWHIIKDVPNPQFRHIILENNDNKPVTNSRDTQEVKFSQGIEMLNIFKSFSSRTSILDDFIFYEKRQKVILEKRNRFMATTAAQFVPKVDEITQDEKSIISSMEATDLGLTDAESAKKMDDHQVAVSVVE